MKRKGLLWVVFTFLFLSLTGFSGLMIKFHREYRKVPSGHFIGNKMASLRALKEKGFPFSFLVLSDTHLSSGAMTLIRKALKAGDYSFMVILGDIVNRPDIRYHDFFLNRMTQEIRIPFPVFLVPGNHDIDLFSDTKRVDRRVTPEIYESLYLRHLRDSLSTKGDGKRYRLIFMHNPPGIIGAASFDLPKQDEFLNLLKTYRVTTCFFGDYHAYSRMWREGTNLILSGGGGGHLRDYQPEWGKFHHIMRITVDENSISEGMIVLRGAEIDFFWTLKRWIFIRLLPSLNKNAWVLYVLPFFFFFCGIFSIRMFVKNLP
jgi:predicted phosphodiesterase